MVKIKSTGNFNNTMTWLKGLREHKWKKELDKFGKKGVDALRSATPMDTGKTANSWGYEIVDDGDTVKIEWTNSNVNKGCNIALILQYGHGTGSGHYIEGIDYINPAMKPIFKQLETDAWEAIRK